MAPEAGNGHGYLMWSAIHAELPRTTPVCGYDRAGYNWSDAAPRPRTRRQSASELRTLLDRTGTPAPVVIVGYSYGGQLAIEFALLHPDRVAGLCWWMFRIPPPSSTSRRRSTRNSARTR